MATVQKACAGALCPATRRVQPFCTGARPRCVVVRADNGIVPAPAAAKPIMLNWTRDKETIRDVFAFGGSAPERVNGRIAMIGFVSILGPEISKKQAVLDQMGEAWFGVFFFSTAIMIASILPKLVSGVSLKELHDSATSENLVGDGITQALALFDQNTELWSGRLAMLGFAGLLAIEAIKGDAFF